MRVEFRTFVCNPIKRTASNNNNFATVAWQYLSFFLALGNVEGSLLTNTTGAVRLSRRFRFSETSRFHIVCDRPMVFVMVADDPSRRGKNTLHNCCLSCSCVMMMLALLWSRPGVNTMMILLLLGCLFFVNHRLLSLSLSHTHTLGFLFPRYPCVFLNVGGTLQVGALSTAFPLHGIHIRLLQSKSTTSTTQVNNHSLQFACFSVFFCTLFWHALFVFHVHGGGCCLFLFLDFVWSLLDPFIV